MLSGERLRVGRGETRASLGTVYLHRAGGLYENGDAARAQRAGATAFPCQCTGMIRRQVPRYSISERSKLGPDRVRSPVPWAQWRRRAQPLPRPNGAAQKVLVGGLSAPSATCPKPGSEAFVPTSAEGGSSRALRSRWAVRLVSVMRASDPHRGPT